MPVRMPAQDTRRTRVTSAIKFNDKGNGGRGEDVDFKPDCAEPSRLPT